MKSGSLSVDELPSKDYKDKLDSKAGYMGLEKQVSGRMCEGILVEKTHVHRPCE